MSQSKNSPASGRRGPHGSSPGARQANGGHRWGWMTRARSADPGADGGTLPLAGCGALGQLSRPGAYQSTTWHAAARLRKPVSLTALCGPLVTKWRVAARPSRGWAEPRRWSTTSSPSAVRRVWIDPVGTDRSRRSSAATASTRSPRARASCQPRRQGTDRLLTAAPAAAPFTCRSARRARCCGASISARSTMTLDCFQVASSCILPSSMCTPGPSGIASRTLRARTSLRRGRGRRLSWRCRSGRDAVTRCRRSPSGRRRGTGPRSPPGP